MKRGLVQKSVVLPHKLTTFKVKVSFVYSLSQEKTTIGFISFCTLFRDGGKLIRFTKKKGNIPTHCGEGGSMTIILDLSPSTRVTLAPECFQNQCVLSKPKSFWNKMKSIIHISGPGEATILDLDFFWTWSSHWITKPFQINFTTRSWKLGEGKRKRFTSAARPSFSPAILTGCGPYMFSRKPH